MKMGFKEDKRVGAMGIFHLALATSGHIKSSYHRDQTLAENSNEGSHQDWNH